MGSREKISEYLGEHHYDENVFIMIKYRHSTDSLIKGLKRSLRSEGYNPVVARDVKLTDDLYNYLACLFCCAHGIAVFDKAEANQMFNPNVAYELGMMHLLKRKTLILVHKSLGRPHTDAAIKLFSLYGTVANAKVITQSWMADNRRSP